MARKYLLFTSAGDKTEFYKHWCGENREYDICVVYYAQREDEPYKEYCDYYVKRPGSKFQNFHHMWLHEERFHDYEHYFIVDDDIIISTDDINTLFHISEEYDLWLLQPSFHESSKISHRITKQQRDSKLRFTNFVEVTAMLFSAQALRKCMAVYDPQLVGWGIDWLFVWTLGKDATDKIAVVDSISCVNPREEHNEQREIDILQPRGVRSRIWTEISKRLCISQWDHQTYGQIFL
jgi:hypothetical protein